MGKGGEEQSIPVILDAQTSQQNADNRCCRACKLVRFRCVFVLLLGFGVVLSALFWLPPFFRIGDLGDLDLDSRFRDWDIVASFVVKKPASFLEDNVLKLEDDIFDEIGVAYTKVKIISLEPSAGSNVTNVTNVVFGVESDIKSSRLLSAAQSLIKSNFVTLIIQQSPLRLTESLFGDPFSFEVLKFKGGITVSPPQSAFLLQKVQILFNFTLNFSIHQIQEHFGELAIQLKSGLELAPYENLYLTLVNRKGSTVDPPTKVQCSVLLAVGNTPSHARLKQLAQTITGGSHSRNLGLNHSEFGRVKQVHLNSLLLNSLQGGDSPSPSPAPYPLPHHHHHHHHHNNHHLPPSPSPTPLPHKHSYPSFAPAPEPVQSHVAHPPGCHLDPNKRLPRKANKHSLLAPPVASPVFPPLGSPHYGAPSPQLKLKPPASAPSPLSGLSPSPDTIHSHNSHPSSTYKSNAEPPDIMPSASPLQSSSSVVGVTTHIWAILLFAVVLNL